MGGQMGPSALGHFAVGGWDVLGGRLSSTRTSKCAPSWSTAWLGRPAIVAAALGVGAAFSLAGFTARAAEPVPYQIITAPSRCVSCQRVQKPCRAGCLLSRHERALCQFPARNPPGHTGDGGLSVDRSLLGTHSKNGAVLSNIPRCLTRRGARVPFLTAFSDSQTTMRVALRRPRGLTTLMLRTARGQIFIFRKSLPLPKPAPVSYTHCDEPPRRWDGPPTVAYQSVHFDIMSEQQQEQWERGLLSLEEGLVHLSAFPKPGEVIQFGKYWLITAAAVTNQFKTPTQGGQTVYDQIISPGRRYEAIASAIAGPHIQASSVLSPLPRPVDPVSMLNSNLPFGEVHASSIPRCRSF